MKATTLLMIFVLPYLGYGIATVNEFKAPLLEEEEPKAGYIDANGWKQGFFVIYGKDVPEKKEYPADGKVEEGVYKDNRKIGEWIVYHFDGKTPRLKGTYIDGHPNGPFVKFDTRGVKTHASTYLNGKLVGEEIVYHENGQVKIRKNYNTDGKEDGEFVFYYDDGTVQYKGQKKNGVITGEAIRYWEDGSVREILFYGITGELLSTTVVNAEPPVKATISYGTGGPDGSAGELREGEQFKPDGFNKVYNKAQELWMNGYFKSGRLWDGELYQYDKDGILLKIEIWKNGAYHSDGHL